MTEANKYLHDINDMWGVGGSVSTHLSWVTYFDLYIIYIIPDTNGWVGRGVGGLVRTHLSWVTNFNSYI